MTVFWYTFGGGKELTDLLMNITMLARSGAFINLIDLLMLTGLFFAFILAAFSGRLFSTPIRNFVIMMIVVYGLLKPTSEVMVVDERSGYNYNVSNVPLGVALFGYFQSSLSRDLVNFFEGTLNNGNFYASYAKYGFGFGPFSTKAIVEFMNSPAIGNGNPEYGRLVTNLSRFSQECFGYSAAQGNNFVALAAIKAMPASNDAFKIFLGQDQSYQYINGGLTMDYVNSNGSSESLGCKDAGSRIYNDIKNFVNNSQMNQAFVNQVQGMLSANPATLDPDLQTAMQYHFNSLSQLDNLKMNILFSSMAYDFIKLGASGLSNNADVSNYAINSVLGSAKMNAIQQAVENFGQGAIAVALAPKMLNFTKMMYYLLFFVLLTLALTPLARAIGKVTLVFFVFLTILEPLYVLLNYLLNTMAYYQATSSGTCNNSPAGILSCLDINSLFYTNVLNFSILGLIGLAYMLASAMVTGSGAVISAIGEKFGSGAITYRGADNNIGSLSNFLNDPLKSAAAQSTSISSFIADGGMGFQSSLANLMAATAARRGIEAGQYATNWDRVNGTTPYSSWTDRFGTMFKGAVVDGFSNIEDFTSGRGTTSQLISSFSNSSNAGLRNLAATLQALKASMGGRDIEMEVINSGGFYTVQFNMDQGGTKGKQSLVFDKDGHLVQGTIDGNGTTVMIKDGKLYINGQDMTAVRDQFLKKAEENRMKEIGHMVAKKLGFRVNDEIASVVGHLFQTSNSWQDFAKALESYIDRKLENSLYKTYEGVNKSGTTQGQTTQKTQTSSYTFGGGVEAGGGTSYEDGKPGSRQGVGASAGMSGQTTTSVTNAESSGNVNETSNVHKTTVRSGREQLEQSTQESGTLESWTQLKQDFNQWYHKKGVDHSKEFSDLKQETQKISFTESMASSTAEEIARQFGISLKPETLRELDAALKSGDQAKVISILGGITVDPTKWVSEEYSAFNKQISDITNKQNELWGKVGKEVPNDELKGKVEKEVHNPKAQHELQKSDRLGSGKPSKKKSNRSHIVEAPPTLGKKREIKSPSSASSSGPAQGKNPADGNKR